MDYEEIQQKLSEDDFVFRYNYIPGFVPKLCTQELFIDKESDFKLMLSFHEQDLAEFNRIRQNSSNQEIEEYIKLNRRQLFLNGKTPKLIRKKLKQIMESPFELKTSYIENSGNEYIPEGVSHMFATINHQYRSFSVNLGYGFDKNRMTSEAEKRFMDLIDLVQDWLENISDDLLKYYTN